MDENIISFNFTNWVTVVAMAAIGGIVLIVMSQAWQHYKAKKSGA